MDTKSALIVGAGSGISAAFARRLSAAGYAIALAARDTDKLAGLVAETGAEAVRCDASRVDEVDDLFTRLDREPRFGTPDVVLFNASARSRGPFVDLEPAAVADALMVSAYAGFLVGQHAARRMLARGSGTILFTGASASVKGYPLSAPFAMGKFALRGMVQSMARELAPQGIHVAHAIIDGQVRNESRGTIESTGAAPDSLLDPDAIAASYMHLVEQPRSAWTWEIELRPWVERF